MTAAEGEHQDLEQAAEGAIGEVGQQLGQGPFGVEQVFLHGPAHQRLHGLRVVQVVVALERRRAQIEVAERIAQAHKVIWNNRDLPTLRQAVIAAWNSLR